MIPDFLIPLLCCGMNRSAHLDSRAEHWNQVILKESHPDPPAGRITSNRYKLSKKG